MEYEWELKIQNHSRHEQLFPIVKKPASNVVEAKRISVALEVVENEKLALKTNCQGY
jgi:hypothetical protein